MSAPPLRWRDLALGLTLTLAALLLRMAYARRANIDVAIGADAPLWALAGLDISRGHHAFVPPLYPALLALCEHPGPGLTAAGLYVSVGASAATAGALYGAVRLAGGSLGGALLAGGLGVFAPDLIAESLHHQPEALLALLLCLCGAAMLEHAARRSLGSTLAVSLAVSLIAITREHGLPLAGLGALFLALVPPRLPASPRAARLLAPLLLLAMVHLTPVAAGLGALAPMWEWPWQGKASVPLDDLRQIWRAPATHLNYLRQEVIAEAGPGADPEAAQAVVDRYPAVLLQPSPAARLSGAIGLNLRWAWAMAADVHLALLAGALGLAAFAWQRRDRALLGALLLQPIWLPSLVVWSQRRHVAVMLPLAFLGLGLGWSALEARWSARMPAPRRRGWPAPAALSALLAAAVVGAAQLRWRYDQGAWLRYQAALADEARPFAQAGERLRDLRLPGELFALRHRFLGPHNYIQIYAGLPLAPLPPHGQLGADLSQPDVVWRSLLLQERGTPPPGWSILVGVEGYTVSRFHPELQGRQRACAAGTVRGELWFLSQDPRYHVQVEPLEGCP